MLDSLCSPFSGEGCDSGTSLDTVETGVLATGIEKEYNICMEGADCTAGLFEDVRTLPEYLSGKMGKLQGNSTEGILT